MHFNKIILKFLSFNLSILLLFLNISCHRSLNLSKPIPVNKSKVIILIKGTETAILHNATVSKENNLSGRIIENTHKYKEQIMRVYISPEADFEFDFGKQVTINLNMIEKIEVYDVNAGKSLLVFAGSILAIFGAIFVIAMLTKESCPFIYVYNGETYEFTGEIYSGAIYKPLERHDYLPLPALKKNDDSEYKLKITNEIKEIQHTNLAELFVFDHPLNSEILVDKYGNTQTLANIQHPITAINSSGESILTEISEKDNISYFSKANKKTDDLIDEVVLSYQKPENVKNGKLIIRAKNTFWLDYVMGEFSDLFGNRFNNWRKKQNSKAENDLRDWTMKQGIPLSVSIETNIGWEYVDYFHIVGPMAQKDDILSIDLSNVEGDVVNIKLEAGALFWEIDYAAMDFTEQIPLKKHTISISSAIDQNGKDVKALLVNDDDKYLDQPEIGDESILTFNVPEQNSDVKRTIILHSKGNYEIIRNPEGIPNIPYLLSFKKPQSLLKFSQEIYKELQEQTNGK